MINASTQLIYTYCPTVLYGLSAPLFTTAAIYPPRASTDGGWKSMFLETNKEKVVPQKPPWPRAMLVCSGQGLARRRAMVVHAG